MRVLLVAVVLLLLACAMFLLVRSRFRDVVDTIGGILSTLGSLGFVSLLVRAWRDPRGADSLDKAVDRLADEVRKDWDAEAQKRGLDANPIRITWSRPESSIGGSPDAAATSDRFLPLPGLEAVGEADLATGEATKLHALYGALLSGRLLITGEAGAGKTSAAIKLLLDALRHRQLVAAEERPKVPVPVILTAQDWDPGRPDVIAWLARKLQATYRLSPTVGAELLSKDRITVILDGLDEIPGELRSEVLKKLNEQATNFRLILLSRTEAIEGQSESGGFLQGAATIQLSPVKPKTAVKYLTDNLPDRRLEKWAKLTDHIKSQPDSVITKALDNPLNLSLARAIYGTGTADEQDRAIDDLLKFGQRPDTSRAAIDEYFLERFIAAAYSQRPATFNLETAQHTLIRIAAQMQHDNTHDLNWWQIHTWTSRKPRVTATAISVVLVGVLSGVLAGGLAFGLAGVLAGGLAGVLAGGLPGVLAFGLPGVLAGGLVAKTEEASVDSPPVVGRLQLKKMQAPQNLSGVLSGVLVVVLAFGLSVGLAVGLAVGLVVVLVVVLAGVLSGVLVGGLEADRYRINSLSPTTSWSRNRDYGLVDGLVGGLVVVLAGVLVGGLVGGLAFGLAAGLSGGLSGGLAFGLSGVHRDRLNAAYRLRLASAELAREWDTPKNLRKFLEDAHKRNVLRAVGPSYQFRHARLRDWLANQKVTQNPQLPGIGADANGIALAVNALKRWCNARSGMT